MTKINYSNDIAVFYGLQEASNNDIMKGVALEHFLEQVKILIQKGSITREEANNAFLCMRLSYGDNDVTFDKDLFSVKCKNAETQTTRPRPFWTVVDDRKAFGEFVNGLYGDWSADINVRYLSSMNNLSVVLVTKTEFVIADELEFNYELKFFTIIRNDSF